MSVSLRESVVHLSLVSDVDNVGRLLDESILEKDPKKVEKLLETYDYPPEVLSAFLETVIMESKIDILELLIVKLREVNGFSENIQTKCLEFVDDCILNTGNDGRLDPIISRKDSERMKEIIDPSSMPDTEPLMPEMKELSLDEHCFAEREHVEGLRSLQTTTGGAAHSSWERTLERTTRHFSLMGPIHTQKR